MKLAVGMSGGVDSAVAAALLLEAGHEVHGVTSINYQASRCCDARSIFGAKSICDQLGIPYRTIDVILPFKQKVVDAYLDGYLAGVTVNPCTICNGEVRFEEIFDEAEWYDGVEAFATGHYARIRQDDATGRWQLLRGQDTGKDQSYMLYRLQQHQLARTLFPLGELAKPEVRRVAERLQLEVAHKPDSQDICFISDDHASFMRAQRGDAIQPGDIVDLDGRVLGRHEGVALYTVGQRRGLGIAAPYPLYVVALDAEANTVVVGPRTAACVSEFVAEQFNWVSLPEQTEPLQAEVQVRYKSPPVPATLIPEGPTRVRIRFDEPQFGVSPGQAGVAYLGEVLVGGGVIAQALVADVPAPAAEAALPSQG